MITSKGARNLLKDVHFPGNLIMTTSSINYNNYLLLYLRFHGNVTCAQATVIVHT